MAKMTKKDTKLAIKKLNIERRGLAKKIEEQIKTEKLGEGWKEQELKEEKEFQLFKRIAEDSSAPKALDSVDFYDLFDPICKLKDDIENKALQLDLSKFVIAQYKYREALKRLSAEFEEAKSIVLGEELGNEADKEKADWEKDLYGKDASKTGVKKAIGYEAEAKSEKLNETGWIDGSDGSDGSNTVDVGLVGTENIENHLNDLTDGDTGSRDTEEAHDSYAAIPTETPELLKGVEKTIAEATKKESKYAKIKRKALSRNSDSISRFVPVYNKYVCSACGLPKRIGEFYVSFGLGNGALVDKNGNLHLSVCKDCSNKILMYYYKNVCKRNIEFAMEMTCATCNIYWDIRYFVVAKEKFDLNDRKGSLLEEYIDIINKEEPCKSFAESPFLEERYSKDLMYQIRANQTSDLTKVDESLSNAMRKQYESWKVDDFGAKGANANADGSSNGNGDTSGSTKSSDKRTQELLNQMSSIYGVSTDDANTNATANATTNVNGAPQIPIEEPVRRDTEGWDETYDWSKADFKNKKDVIRIIGYDPFVYVADAENKKTLYRD